MNDVYIHETAVIDQPCTISAGTKIWHWCHIMSDVHIGQDCMLGQGVFIGLGTQIDDRVRIQNYAQVHTAVLESDVFIGPGVIFTNVEHPRASYTQLRDVITVKRGATIGAGAIILPGVRIGEFAMVGAGAVVTQDVPAYALMVGNPARQVGTVNEEGMPVRGKGRIWGLREGVG